MKKLLLMASAICMGLLSSINVAVAHPGQSACAFNAHLIKKAGFVSGCIITRHAYFSYCPDSTSDHVLVQILHHVSIAMYAANIIC